MENDETFRVWVACLACYNEGRLVGEWFDAGEAPQDVEAFNDAVDPLPAGHFAGGHEELWCLDTENSPVDGEMSPMDAAYYAELIENLPIPLDALTAWLKYSGESLSEDSIVDAEDKYIAEGDEAFDESIRESHPEDDLPEWAKTGYEDIIKGIKRDMRLNGEYVELDGHYFRTY